jgi:hypothetical protein
MSLFAQRNRFPVFDEGYVILRSERQEALT